MSETFGSDFAHEGAWDVHYEGLPVSDTGFQFNSDILSEGLPSSGPEGLEAVEESMRKANRKIPEQGPRLYRDLAEWFPLLTPVDDYAEEAVFYRKLFEAHCRRPLRTLLDLGSGGGHNAFHLKTAFSCTLLDLEPAMLSLSRRLNPECEHVQGDMRSIRLGRVFDCVLLHDAVSYMTTRADLTRAVATAFEHTAPGGVAMFLPDHVSETFKPGTETGGSEGGGRALRYLEWRWVPDSRSDMFVTDMAYLLRYESGTVEVIHDRHLMGLFPKAFWLKLIGDAGFRALAIPFEPHNKGAGGTNVFLGLRPGKRKK